MVRWALGYLKRNDDGAWVAVNDGTVDGPFGTIPVRKGQVFPVRSSFAGYQNFTQYLDSVSAEAPPDPPQRQ